MVPNHDLVPIALDYVDGFQFENFVNAFFAAQYGTNFVPLGGVHDGGADGIFVGVSEDATGRVLQSSIREAIENKVRDTLAALAKSGRNVRQLI